MQPLSGGTRRLHSQHMKCGGCTVREALSGVQLVRLLPAAYMLAEDVQARTSLFAMNAFQ